MLFLRDQPCPANLFVRGITTRSGKQVKPPKNSDSSGSSFSSESEEQGEVLDVQHPPPPVVSNPPAPKHVTFQGEHGIHSPSTTSDDDIVELHPSDPLGEAAMLDSHMGEDRSPSPVTLTDATSSYEDPDWEAAYAFCPK